MNNNNVNFDEETKKAIKRSNDRAIFKVTSLILGVILTVIFTIGAPLVRKIFTDDQVQKIQECKPLKNEDNLRKFLKTNTKDESWKKTEERFGLDDKVLPVVVYKGTANATDGSEINMAISCAFSNEDSKEPLSTQIKIDGNTEYDVMDLLFTIYGKSALDIDNLDIDEISMLACEPDLTKDDLLSSISEICTANNFTNPNAEDNINNSTLANSAKIKNNNNTAVNADTKAVGPNGQDLTDRPTQNDGSYCEIGLFEGNPDGSEEEIKKEMLNTITGNGRSIRDYLFNALDGVTIETKENTDDYITYEISGQDLSNCKAYTVISITVFKTNGSISLDKSNNPLDGDVSGEETYKRYFK